jgi:hypothetical protein
VEQQADREEPVINSAKDLNDAMKHLRISEPKKFELDSMIEEGLTYMRKYIKQPEVRVESSEDESEDEPNMQLRLTFLISGSDTFRKLLLNLITDPVYCALVKTHLADLVSPKQLKTISAGGKEMTADNIGSIIYSSRSCNFEWFVLLSGKLKIKTDPSLVRKFEHENEDCEIWEGEMFGGFDFFQFDSEKNSFELEVIKPCTYIALKGEILETMIDEDPEVASDVYDMLGECSNHLLMPARNQFAQSPNSQCVNLDNCDSICAF